MQKPDDAMLLVHEHLVGVYMDLVEYNDEDEDDVRKDFEEMTTILLEALQLQINATTATENGKEFTCKITIP
jgi:hypothetical protein